MLDWSLEQREHHVMILIPGNEVAHREAEKSYSATDTFKVEQKGEKIAVLALGDFFQRGEELCRAIKDEFGFSPTLINPRFASGLDKNLLEELKKDHSLVITLESGILNGGFGEKVASFYGTSGMKVKNYGLEKKFIDRYKAEELLSSLGITAGKIVEDIKKITK